MIYTVGHSDHPWERFASLLNRVGVSLVIDVRSFARSRFAQFSGPALRHRLEQSGIAYEHWPFWGGKHPDGTPIDFEGVAPNALFHEQVAQLEAMSALPGCTIVLLCSEHEPRICHRLALSGRLVSGGLAVSHVLRDGRVEHHDDYVAPLGLNPLV